MVNRNIIIFKEEVLCHSTGKPPILVEALVNEILDWVVDQQDSVSLQP